MNKKQLLLLKEQKTEEILKLTEEIKYLDERLIDLKRKLE